MSCIICYENFSDNPIYQSKYCKCNYDIHLECFNIMRKKNKYLCPICRIKDNTNNISLYEIFNERTDFLNILNQLLLFLVGCGFFGFILALALSLIVTIIYIIPKFIILYTNERYTRHMINN